MSCQISNITADGVVKANPTETLVVNKIDDLLRSGAEVSAQDLYKDLINHQYVNPGGKLVMPILTDKSGKQSLDSSSLQSLVRLNMHMAVNYGATGRVFRIQGFKAQGRPDNFSPSFNQPPLRNYNYYLTIDQDQLNQLRRLREPLQLSPYDREQLKQYTSNHVRGSQESKNFQLVRNPLSPVLTQAIITETSIVKSATDVEMTNYDLKSDSRDIGAEVDPVAYRNVADQIKAMQDSFKRSGVNIDVEIDPTLEVKGRVIAESGKNPVVKLNPLKITEDTHIHEFSHILVELLGENDPVVKQAMKELEGTELYAKVKERYPELSKEALDKEVLVTAIGLAGAKINRQNPNKFQKIVNRIFRKIAKALGFTNESAVEDLARTMLDGRFDKTRFTQSITYLSADSRGTADLAEKFDNLLTDVKIGIKENIARLKRRDEEANEKAVAKLEILEKKLDKVKQVEDLMEFVTYTSSLSKRAEEVFNKIEEEYNENMGEEDRLRLLSELHKVNMYLNDFYGGVDKSKSIMGRVRSLVAVKLKRMNRRLTEEQRATDPEYAKLSSVEKTLVDAIDRMDVVHEDYLNTGIPMIADMLMEYHTPEINDQINSIIDNIDKNKRLIAIDKDAEYNALKRANKEGTLTDDAYQQALVELNIRQMEKKRIGKDTIEAELRKAQTDKSYFSYLLDPLVYSSQASLQMFALTVKNKMLEANQNTQDVIFKLAGAYDEYSQVKGTGFDANKFNEDITELVDHSYFDNESGKYKTIKVLSFVQPYDVTAYRNAESKMYEDLGKKYNIPEDKSQRNMWFKDKSNAATIRSFYRGVSEWYAQNSEPSADSKATLVRLLGEKTNIQSNLNLATAENDGDKMAYYMNELSEINSIISKIYDPTTKQFKGRAVQPNAKYINPKFTALQNNPAAFKYYTALLDQYKESQTKIGKGKMPGNSWENFSYVAPFILSDGLEKVQRDGAIDTIKLKAREGFNFLSTDTSYGDAINANKESGNKLVPIFYTNPTDEKMITRDMVSSIIQFAGMSDMYKAKSEIQGAVMLMRDIVSNRETIATTADSNPIIHRLSNMVGKTRYKTTDTDSANFKHLDEWIDTVFFGETELKESLNRLGQEISVNKLAGKLAGYTALNNLAFNALQATNQLLIDNVRLIEEGVSGQFFGKADLAWAKSQFHLSLQGLGQLKDFEAFAPKTKLGQAILYFDALSNVTSSIYKDKSGPKALRAVRDTPMMLQSIAENETALTRMLALMKSYEGKIVDTNGQVILNEEGKPANLWDVFILDEKTGRYSIDSRVKDANKLRIQLRNRISGLTKKTNQVKNKFDDAMLQRRWYGKLIMLFRRYFVPSLRRYYGHGNISRLGGGLHRDIELGTVSEGLIHSTFRLFKESFAKRGNFAAVYKQMEDFEKQNVKRFGVQIGFVITCLAILSALQDDDDDDESFAEHFAIYQALRMQSELTQFLKPNEFVKMAESPSATIRTVGKTTELLNQFMIQTGGMITGDTEGMYYERKSGSHLKGDNKFLARLEDLIPILNGISRSQNPEEAAKWFNLGAGSGK